MNLIRAFVRDNFAILKSTLKSKAMENNNVVRNYDKFNNCMHTESGRYYFSKRMTRDEGFFCLLVHEKKTKSEAISFVVTANALDVWPNLKSSRFIIRINDYENIDLGKGVFLGSDVYHNEQGIGPYCEQTVCYNISLAQLKKICDARTTELCFSGSIYPAFALPANFIYWCQTFYNGAFDCNAYLEGVAAINSEQRVGKIKSVIFWCAMIVSLIVIVNFFSSAFGTGDLGDLLIGVIGAIVWLVVLLMKSKVARTIISIFVS